MFGTKTVGPAMLWVAAAMLALVPAAVFVGRRMRTASAPADQTKHVSVVVVASREEEEEGEEQTESACANAATVVDDQTNQWMLWIDRVAARVGMIGDPIVYTEGDATRLRISLDTDAALDVWVCGPEYMECPRVRDISWDAEDRGILITPATEQGLEAALLLARAARPKFASV